MPWYEYLISALPAIVATITSSAVGVFVINTVKAFIKQAREDKKLKELLEANAVLATENRLLRKELRDLTEAITKVKGRPENEEQK